MIDQGMLGSGSRLARENFKLSDVHNVSRCLLLSLRGICLDTHERIQIEKYAGREEEATETHKDYECNGARPDYTDRFNEKS